MDETRVELLPCPHGKPARVLNIGGDKPYSVIVDPNRHKCVPFGFFAERSDAIAAWNEIPRPTDPGEDKVEAVAAWKDALAYTLDDWQALSRIVKTNIVEADGPDRVRWEGVWYEGPLATAYHRTLRAIEKMADRNIEILSPLTGAAIAAMGHTPPSGEDGELRELLIESFDFLRGVDDAADLRKRVLIALQGIGGDDPVFWT
jgi:hypothetical protein